MKLYLIHCGFYDEEISDGIFEFHVNIPVMGENIEEAKKKVRLHPQFLGKKMHIDGVQEIKTIEGHRIALIKDEEATELAIASFCHRDL
jgi:hypothetical protein